jgi:hypothetical protein
MTHTEYSSGASPLTKLVIFGYGTRRENGRGHRRGVFCTRLVRVQSDAATVQAPEGSTRTRKHAGDKAASDHSRV